MVRYEFTSLAVQCSIEEFRLPMIDQACAGKAQIGYHRFGRTLRANMSEIGLITRTTLAFKPQDAHHLPAPLSVQAAPSSGTPRSARCHRNTATSRDEHATGGLLQRVS